MRDAKLIIICIIMLVTSCSKSSLHTSVEDSSSQSPENIIGWSVSADNHTDALNPKSRALVNDYNNLRDACTQSENKEAEKIGLFGKYNLDGTEKIIFENADLWWWEKEGGNPFLDQNGSNSNWNYSGEHVYWKDNAEYLFRAYFPKSKVDIQPGSGADRILSVYDSEVSQYDMMVARRKIAAKSENPVKLDLKHTLAALKFDFQFVDAGVKDNLLACWLENDKNGTFYTSSTLNYGEEIVWPKSTPVPEGKAIYYWEPVTPLGITGTGAVEAYSRTAISGKGNTYTGNSGWLLIIPQSSLGASSLKLCFKTSTGGNAVYSATLPAYDFKAGYRYNYHIKMTSTKINVGLTIAEWNERKSSYDIDFNE